MNNDLFQEMQTLLDLDPSETTEEQDERLAQLLALHDSGQAYFADEGESR